MRRHGAVLLVFNEWLHPDDAVLQSCKVRVEGNKDYNWSDVTSVNTTIASPRQPSIRISEKLDCLVNFKCSSSTVSDLSDIPMHIFLLPSIISYSLILRRVSCNVHRFSSRFWFSLSNLIYRLLSVHVLPLEVFGLIVDCPTCDLLNSLYKIRPRANLKF